VSGFESRRNRIDKCWKELTNIEAWACKADLDRDFILALRAVILAMPEYQKKLARRGR
jgi:hypothetical protein